ncbi:MAG: response regulator [Gemmatimonadetes bacterium]|nr:response regulator [Gemmatimonadota bacterium]
MRVLYADDEEMMRLLLGTLLEQAGHTAELVNDGQEAWDAWQRGRHELVILDWMMPKVEGDEVCRRIRQLDADRASYILMVTAKDGHEDLSRVLEAGADDYVSKPLTPQVFLTRLRIAEQRIAVQETRRKAEHDLKEARYLAGIGETAIAVQHEINNPLAALISVVGLLKQGLYSPEEMPEALDVVAEQANRIATVTKRLNSLEKPRSVEYAYGERMIDLSGARHDDPIVP